MNPEAQVYFKIQWSIDEGDELKNDVLFIDLKKYDALCSPCPPL